MSTQLIGFSIGGIFKRFVVPPPSMIWPQTLLTAVLFNTLHGQETSGTQASGGISRGRFFSYVFIGYFFYSQFFLFRKLAFVLRFYSIVIPRFLAVLSLHRSLELFVDLLDNSKQCQGQQSLWGQARFGQWCSHFRLGSNCLHQLPLSHPLVGCGKHGPQYRVFLLVHRSYSLRKTTLLAFRSFSSSELGFCSTSTLGTALTYLYCPHTLSITQGSNITSLGSSIPIHPSTFRLTTPTAPSSFLPRSPFPTAFHLRLSPPPLHILFSTTANIYGIMLVAHCPNNLIFTPA